MTTTINKITDNLETYFRQAPITASEYLDKAVSILETIKEEKDYSFTMADAVALANVMSNDYLASIKLLCTKNDIESRLGYDLTV